MRACVRVDRAGAPEQKHMSMRRAQASLTNSCRDFSPPALPGFEIQILLGDVYCYELR